MRHTIISDGFFVKSGILASIALIPFQQLLPDTKPNIIFILTDDHRFDLLGINGHQVLNTPNVDQLARDGMQFSRAYVTSAISTPSRASIFTGQYERKHGINFNSGTSMSENAWNSTYPMLLRKNGYYTGYIGKNHVPVGSKGYKSGIIEQSFDYWFGGHGHLSFYPKKVHSIFKGARNDTQVEVLGEGVDDFLNNQHCLEGAVRFINQRPADKPFCLTISFNLPHGAGTSTMKQLPSDPEIYKSLYRDKKIDMPVNYVAKADIKSSRIPVNILHASDRQDEYNYVDEPAALQERIIRQMQSVTGIDNLIGNLREQLDQLGISKNTIIIFTSDHGIMLGEYGLGGKALCYEPCTHVPFIIYDPGMPVSSHGAVVDELVQIIDIAPTILTYAGVAIPEKMQGKQLNSILKGEMKSVRSYIFTENLWSTCFGNPRCEAVQDKEWKYIRYYNNDNVSSRKLMEMAKEMGLNQQVLLYGNNDYQIARYQHFLDSPLKGEPAVYEELFHLKDDPKEVINLARDKKHINQLQKMRKVWAEEIKKARGEGKPDVVRWTIESQKHMQESFEAK
ncbi:MAG: sulfatase-like hydrolase/transferase [Paludibacter sp.]|jgi:arylsulfatase A-like enzyme|nr:sulfatase-like hydrolase/transferase [Paludibacter sp.]